MLNTCYREIISPGIYPTTQMHWVVVEGEPEVQIDDHVQHLKANQSVYVPIGAVHRLSNPGSEPVVLIEVQTGTYFGEDDIIRLADAYNRE